MRWTAFACGSARINASVLATAAALVSLMVVPVVGQAQSVASDQRSPVPRTPWGDPDLQGLWNFATNTPLQRPPKYVGREWLTGEEVAAEDLEWSTFATSKRRSELTAQYDLSLNFNQVWWDLGRSTGRTSLITDPADGRWPRLTPSRQGYEASDEWQRLQTVDWGLAPARGPEELGFPARCLLDRQMPIIPSSDNNHVQIQQSPGYVVVLHEKIHDVRIVPVIDQPDVPDQVRQWLGVSRGRWEGDTLVAETKNFHAQADYFGSGVDRHVIERFTRRGEDAIEYSFTVTDPSVWTRPWSAMVPWRAVRGPLFEYACHEGNYSVPLILRGARADESEEVSAR